MVAIKEFEDFIYKCICNLKTKDIDENDNKQDIINRFFYHRKFDEEAIEGTHIYNYYLVNEALCIKELINHLINSKYFKKDECHIDYNYIATLNENVQKVFIWYFYLHYDSVIQCPTYITTFTDFMTVMETIWSMKHNSNPLRSIFKATLCDIIEKDIIVMTDKWNDEAKLYKEEMDREREKEKLYEIEWCEKAKVEREAKHALKISDPHMYYTQYGITSLEKYYLERDLNVAIKNAKNDEECQIYKIQMDKIKDYIDYSIKR
jgi:hypothetical protein